jgi:hypothetical protein
MRNTGLDREGLIKKYAAAGLNGDAGKNRSHPFKVDIDPLHL